MYETGRNIIEAQRAIGLDCAMVDAFNPGTVQRDGTFETVPYQYAEGADVYVMHSHIPEPYLHDGTPVVCCLHGMPMYSWQSECYYPERGNDAPWSQLLGYFKGTDLARFVTFWREHLAWWEVLERPKPESRVRYVPRPIDIGDLQVEGPAVRLKGSPAIIMCDQFRLIKDPLNLWFGAVHFADRYPQAQVHYYAAPPPDSREFQAVARTLDHPAFRPIIGSLEHIVPRARLMEAMRGADILLSGVPVTSRTVAEAKALGCDAVSGGCEGTYTADAGDPLDVARALEEAWLARRDDVEGAKQRNAAEARELWNPLNTARGMLAVYEELV